MRVRFERSFGRDLRKIKDRKVLGKIKEMIFEMESVSKVEEFRGDLRKLKSGKNRWRVRIGDCRVGLEVEEGTVIFVRILHRRDIYKYFP